MLFCISVVAALLMAVVLFRLFFSGFPDFVEGFCRPNSSTLKLVIWAALAIVTGVSAYYTLPKHVPLLARYRNPTTTTATATDAGSKRTAVQARTTSRARTNSVSAPLPTEATLRGVKVGDTVQISAIHPPVALRSAVITSMDDTQLVVRGTSGSGSYSILWKDLTGLKPATISTNKAGSK
jgi:hypothetical protein